MPIKTSTESAPQRITTKVIASPIGPLFAGVTDNGVCLLAFGDQFNLDKHVSRLTGQLHAETVTGEHPILNQLTQQLDEYFEGSRKDFDLPLVTTGTEFQQKAWQMLSTIPHGETRSYSEQAEAAGNPNAVRAVATANANNRIAILIPCHRVIAKNGSLAGYGGELWRKQYLLDLEQSR